MKRLVFGVIASSTLSLLAPSVAHAQNAGFSVNHFNPSERGSEWFVLESLDLRGHMRPAIGVVGDYGYRPLVARDASDNYAGSLVSHQFFVHPGASLVLWDRVRASFSVPVMLYTDGDAVLLGSTLYSAPASSAAIGDVRLGVDVRLFGTHGDAITGAFGVQVSLPTGDSAAYAGDGFVRGVPRFMVAGDIDKFTYAAKIGVTLRGREEAFAGGQVGSDIDFGLAAGLRLLQKKLVVGPEVYGHATFTKGAFFSKESTPLEGVFGAHYTLADDWRIGGGVGTGLTRGFGTPVVRGLAVIEWAPAMAKPKEPEPPPPADRDHDGVLDFDDACPDVPGIKTDDPKTNGCPPDLDRDKDGILNDVDACPDSPGKPDKNPKRNGCPAVAVQGNEIKILDQVKFVTDSAVIVNEKTTLDILNGVAAVLKDHPEIKKVRVEGHTDNVGGAAHNKTLSEKRAASVVKWLVKNGIQADRLSSAGFGPDKPIDDNKTVEGRRNNRRVEFHIE